MLAMLFAVFNQVSGINAIIYYSPRIFEMTGLGESSSLLSTAGLGAINFMFTLLAIGVAIGTRRRDWGFFFGALASVVLVLSFIGLVMAICR